MLNNINIDESPHVQKYYLSTNWPIGKKKKISTNVRNIM